MNSLLLPIVLLASSLSAQPGANSGIVDLPGVRFEIIATVSTDRAPHGIAFSQDGSRAYVACEGGDVIAVLDTTTYQVLETLPAGHTPIDCSLEPDGKSLIVTQFLGDSIIRVPLDGSPFETVQMLTDGPSLFTPRAVRGGRRYLVCERGDTLCEVNADGTLRRAWSAVDRPYPASVTRGGILVFTPLRDSNDVLVMDVLNDRVAARTSVGLHPEGGALTNDDVSYVVACGGTNELKFINTATFEVVATVSDGVGDRPFSVVMTSDDRYALVNNSGSDTVSILDIESRAIVGELRVGQKPIVMRAHPDGQRIFISCEDDNIVTVVRLVKEPVVRTAEKTEVIVMGMIHSGHRTSERYSLDVVRNLIRAISPDAICAEIPPNRFDAALEQQIKLGKIDEPRVRVFPEYVDVVFPLLSEMKFKIVPTAGWTKEMNDYRNAKLLEISKDPARAEQWAEFEQAGKRMEKQLEQIDANDNPRVIHSAQYDAIIDQAYGGPYNTYFNDDLDDGGWDNINAKHFALIEKYLDQVRGQGTRVLITYGAGHKGWFLEALAKRDDITLLDMGPFLDKIESADSD